MLSGTKPAIEGVSERLECPLIVFINSRSGGRDGFNLAVQLNRAIGKAQVCGLWITCRDGAMSTLDASQQYE